jgi:hypothetical protein
VDEALANGTSAKGDKFAASGELIVASCPTATLLDLVEEAQSSNRAETAEGMSQSDVSVTQSQRVEEI